MEKELLKKVFGIDIEEERQKINHKYIVRFIDDCCNYRQVTIHSIPPLLYIAKEYAIKEIIKI